MKQVQRNAFEREVFASDNRSDDEGEEDDEHDEVEDSEADDASFSELRLLERVDRWSNLATGKTVSDYLHYNIKIG